MRFSKTTGFALLGLCIMSISGIAQAADKWGMAGCGLGALVFEDKPGKIQILAATTNGIYMNNTFAMSSGTSNCTQMSSHDEASLFITVNQEALAKDISRGSGETISGLAKILHCSDEGLLGSELQRNYSELFPQGPTQKKNLSNSIEQTIKSNPSLRSSCTIYS